VKVWLAIVFTLALLATERLVSAVLGTDLLWFLILGSAAWVAWDSSKIHLTQYQSGISLRPPLLFFGIALLWIVGFPWYLAVRHRIKTGTALRKQPA
jgi:hypothetical protein